jgi:large subunit ribosomal protein L19
MIEKEMAEQLKPGTKVRIQDTKTGQFEGVILACKHGREEGGTFTIRATVAGVGMEKVYPFNCPSIKSVKIVSAPERVRRAKLYYLRTLSAKKTRRKLGTQA